MQAFFAVITVLLISIMMASLLRAAEKEVSQEVKEAIDAIGEYSVEKKDAALTEAEKGFAGENESS